MLKLRKLFLSISQIIVMVYFHILMVMLGEEKERRGADPGGKRAFLPFHQIFQNIPEGGGGWWY